MVLSKGRHPWLNDSGLRVARPSRGVQGGEHDRLGDEFRHCRGENKAFAEKFGFPYPLLCDTDRTVGLAYHATEEGSTRGAARISYLINEAGVIEQAYDNVDAGKHAAMVLADLGA